MSAVKHRRTGLEEFLGGLGVFAVCIVLVAFHLVPGFVVFIGVFLGAIPMVKGLRRIGRDRAERSLEDDHYQEDLNLAVQQAILQQASRNGGIVTPTLVALSANVPLESADLALQNMAARGYAEMNIRENGTIEYLISDFRR